MVLGVVVLYGIATRLSHVGHTNGSVVSKEKESLEEHRHASADHKNLFRKRVCGRCVVIFRFKEYLSSSINFFEAFHWCR